MGKSTGQYVFYSVMSRDHTLKEGKACLFMTYDEQFKEVFDAIRELLTPPEEGVTLDEDALFPAGTSMLAGTGGGVTRWA